MQRKDEEWAIFWCSLLHPVLFKQMGRAEERDFLRELAELERVFPNGVRKKPSLSTLKRKLGKYRKEGFDGLFRKARNDRGHCRAHRQEIIDKAIELKRDQPKRPSGTINKFLKTFFAKTIPKSTLYRHLHQAGATRVKLGVSQTPVRRRWTRDYTNALWVGDFEEGPYVLYGDQVVPTHLCGFIDCHSRYVAASRYYFRQNLDILIDSLLRAWESHGTSDAVYVDQAKVFQARALKTACYRLEIELLHRKKGDPAGGGLIEKFFQTAQGQFEAEVRAGDILTLAQLNRGFSAWLEISYHRSIHSEILETPHDRYEKGLRIRRPVDMQKALECFMTVERRTVHKDFADVQLHGRFYRVDKRLRGDRVEVRYDQYNDSETVLIYSLHGEYLGKGILHNRERGEDPSEPPPSKKPKYNYLDLLIREHEEELRKKTHGIDYRQARQKKRWPFSSFAKSLSELLGRKGGLSAFSAQELETLQKFFNRNPSLDEALLRQAFERAIDKTLAHVIYELQELINRKER